MVLRLVQVHFLADLVFMIVYTFLLLAELNVFFASIRQADILSHIFFLFSSASQFWRVPTVKSEISVLYYSVYFQA